MTFKKGDNVNHSFKLPIGDYTPGGTLYFTAKPEIDNDTSDAAAVINKSFADSLVVLDATHATWPLAFLPADIVGVNFENGETNKEYIGEFQWIEDDGTIHSYPDNDDFINVVIYADVRRGAS